MPNSQSHLLIRYNGNKLYEYKNFKQCLDLNDKKNIIECFSGSGATAFNIWLEYGDKFNYYLNDKNKQILDYFDYIKQNDLNDVINKLNIEKRKYDTQEKHKKLYNEFNVDKDIFKQIILSKISNFHMKLFNARDDRKNQQYQTTSRLNKYQIKFKEFLNSPNLYITNDDWKICYDKFKDDENSLIIFDPPYIDTDNTFYNEDCRSFSVYDELDYIKNNKSKSYFILQDIPKTEELFKEWNILLRYNKVYNVNGKTKTHIVYSN